MLAALIYIAYVSFISVINPICLEWRKENGKEKRIEIWIKKKVEGKKFEFLFL